MTATVISMVTMFVYGYVLVGPANRGYSWRAWAFIATFLPFMYLFVILMSLFVGGIIEGRPIAPVTAMIFAVAYSAAVATATGLGAGLRSRRAS